MKEIRELPDSKRDKKVIQKILKTLLKGKITKVLEVDFIIYLGLIELDESMLEWIIIDIEN